MSRLRLLVSLGLRGVLAHRVRSAVVGSMLGLGAFLVVFGAAFYGAVQASMEGSITGSLAGELQLSSAAAPDPLALYGAVGVGGEDIGEIPDFARVEAALAGIPGLRALVPMGISTSTIWSGNEIDHVLAELREAADRGDAAGLRLGEERVRAIAATLARDVAAAADIAADPARAEADRLLVERVATDAFWAGFAADPYPALELLEGRLAPLAADGRAVALRTIGTDPERFAAAFERFHVETGEPIPPGGRGLLLSRRVYEKQLKNRVARELDALREAWLAGARFADDANLRSRAERLSRQYAGLLFQLDPAEARALEPELRVLVAGEDLPALLRNFLGVDDANLLARHAFFYEKIAPSIRLYEVEVGGELTLRSTTRSGQLRAVRVPVRGVYEFEGQQTAGLASAATLVDLATWRELHGARSAAEEAEIAAIKAAAGVKELDAADFDDAMFGAGVHTEQAEAVAFVPPVAAPIAEAGGALVTNVAVRADDPEAVAAAIRARAEAEGLGLRVVGWREATGMLGQVVVGLRGMLALSAGVVLLVALVILNTTTVSTVLQRTTELGTMRAIGASRGTVIALVLSEILLLGLVAGGAGAGLAALALGRVAERGIPAPAEVFVLLFGGPRLHPQLHGAHLLFGLGGILLASLLSALYPALLAARVPPVVAMRTEE